MLRQLIRKLSSLHPQLSPVILSSCDHYGYGCSTIVWTTETEYISGDDWLTEFLGHQRQIQIGITYCVNCHILKKVDNREATAKEKITWIAMRGWENTFEKRFPFSKQRST